MLKIENKDCIAFMKGQEASTFDMIITSPPYNLNIQYGTYKDNKSKDHYLSWIKNVFQEATRILKDNGSLFLNNYFL